MKNHRNGIRGLLLLLSALLLLASCSNLPKLEYTDNGSFVNKESGVSYLAAPITYKAQRIVENAEIAKIPYTKTDDMILYSIEKVDPERYLANADGQLFYNSTLTLPALWDMKVEQVNVVNSAAVEYSLVSITDAADLDAIITAYQSGTHFSRDEISVELTPKRYDLEFVSSIYPAFYYVLTYWTFPTEVLVYEVIDSVENATPTYPGVEMTFETFEDETYAVYHFGKNILFDRLTGQCYPVGDTVADYLA